MNRTIYYGWLFVVLLVFLSTIFQFVKRGASLRIALGLLIGTAGLILLRYMKNK